MANAHINPNLSEIDPIEGLALAVLWIAHETKMIAAGGKASYPNEEMLFASTLHSRADVRMKAWGIDSVAKDVADHFAKWVHYTSESHNILRGAEERTTEVHANALRLAFMAGAAADLLAGRLREVNILYAKMPPGGKDAFGGVKLSQDQRMVITAAARSPWRWTGQHYPLLDQVLPEFGEQAMQDLLEQGCAAFEVVYEIRSWDGVKGSYCTPVKLKRLINDREWTERLVHRDTGAFMGLRCHHPEAESVDLWDDECKCIFITSDGRDGYGVPVDDPPEQAPLLAIRIERAINRVLARLEKANGLPAARVSWAMAAPDAASDRESIPEPVGKEAPATLAPWTTESIALHLGVTEKTVRVWCSDKRPPCQNAYKVGQAWRIPAADFTPPSGSP